MFQSTRPRGARQKHSNQYQYILSFNPRARAGRDPTQQAQALPLRVSIHAPARGATPTASPPAPAPSFQSTRPRGARPMTFVTEKDSTGFNPRARAGRDRWT